MGYFEVQLCFMMSLWRHTLDVYLFWYVWKEETHTYIMVPIKTFFGGWFSFQVHNWDLGVVTTPLGKPLTGVQIQILTSAHGIESPLKSELDNSTEILFL